MTILPKALCRFNAIPTKLPMAFLRELKQKNFTISMETPMTQIAKGIVRRKYAQLTDFREFYKDTVRPIWYWPKNRNTNQWNRIESSEISTHTYGYLTNDMEKAMAPHSSTLAWKIHGQRSLVGRSPWGR